MSAHPILIRPLDVIIESRARTYEELTIELLNTPNYYFSNSSIGSRQFGSLPQSGEVYLRQQSNLKLAVEEIVTDDPIVVPIDKEGRGSINLYVPIPRGCQLILRELHFTEDPKVRNFHLNGEGPISFKYLPQRIGLLEYPLVHFESALIFTRITHIKKVIIYMAPVDTISAVEMFFPGTPQIQLADYFKFTEETFHRFDDYSYRTTWETNGRRLRSIELPSGFLNWRIILQHQQEDLILNNKNGIASVDLDADTFGIVLVPPSPLKVNTVRARLYYDQAQPEIEQLKSHLRRAEQEIRRLHRLNL